MGETGTGLDYWRKRLGDVQLPVFSAATRIEAMLVPSISLHALGQHLEADLPLALEVMLVAVRLPQLDGDVQSLQHALNVLGSERVQAIVRARSKRPFNPDKPAHRHLAQAISTSRLAALLIMTIESRKETGNAGYLAWVALLLGLARWRLAFAAPEIFDEIESRADLGAHRAEVERMLLGCSVDELNHQLLVDAGFSTDASLLRSVAPDARMLAAAGGYAWTENLAPELPPEIGRWLRQRTTNPLLAHLIAWSAHDDWYGNRTRLLERVFSCGNNLPLDRFVASLHQTAAEASRGFVLWEHVVGPAERLFWPPKPPRSLVERARGGSDDAVAAVMPGRHQVGVEPAPGDERMAVRRRDGAELDQAAGVRQPARVAAGFELRGEVARAPRQSARDDEPRTVRIPTVAKAGSESEGARAPASRVDPGLVALYARNCESGVYQDLRQLVNATCMVLESGLGLKRCLLFLKLAQTEELGCYLAHGYGSHLQPRQLSIPVAQDNLIARIFRQSGALWADSGRIAAARLQLPEALREVSLDSGFLLSSLKMKDKAVGVLWADSGDLALALTERHYGGFRQMAQHFGSAFAAIAQTRKR